jgi:hypothetical protein
LSTTPKEGQFLVYLASARTDVLLDPATGVMATEDTPIPVFDRFEDAVQYAEEAVRRIPTARADVYDHNGRAGDSLRRIYPPALRRRYDPARRARRDAWAGSILLGLFVVWAITLANRSETHFFWFYMGGIKILVLGSIFFIRGIVYFLDQRTR